MRSVINLLIFLLLFIGSYLFSESISIYENFDQGSSLQEHIMRNGYSAPARIDLDAGVDLILKGSCLFWKATEQGLDLGYTTKDNEINFHQINFDYQLGAKGTLGAHLPHDNWNFYFTYLFFHTNKKSGFIEDSTFIDFWYHNDIIEEENFNSISATWKLKINLMDTCFSRPFYLGRSLTVEPFFGTRGGWIKQDYDIPGTSTNIILQQFENKNNSNSWLFGALGGVNTNWIFFNFFRMYANFSGALMYQKFNIGNVQQIIIDNQVTSNISTKYKLQNITPSFDTNFGLAYGTYLYNKRIHIDFSIGYDFVIFLDQNAISFITGGLLKQTTGATLNNLNLYGINGSFRLDF